MTEIFVTAGATKDELLRKLEVYSVLAPSGFTLTMEPGGALHLISALRAQDAYREARELSDIAREEYVEARVEAVAGLDRLNVARAALHVARAQAERATDRVQWALFVGAAIYTALSMVLA